MVKYYQKLPVPLSTNLKVKSVMIRTAAFLKISNNLRLEWLIAQHNNGVK